MEGITIGIGIVKFLVKEAASNALQNLLPNKSLEEKVAQALGKALDKLGYDNEFYKNDVKRQIGDVIDALIWMIDYPDATIPSTKWFNRDLLDQFKTELEKDANTWAYLQNLLLNYRIEKLNERNENEIGRLDDKIKELKRSIDENIRYLTSVPALNDVGNIIGREKDLDELWKMLSEKKHVMLTGLWGIGKTKLAQLLFHNYRDRFEEVAWIGYKGSLRQSFLYRMEDYRDRNDPWEAMMNDLHNDGKTKLFIVDNVDDDADQNPLSDKELRNLTGWENTTILLTSRLKEELHPYFRYELKALGKDDCIAVFNCYYGSEPDTELVDKIMELANCHTLTIELLAKGARRKNLESYYEKIKSGFDAVSRKMCTEHHEGNATIEEHLRYLFDIQKRSDADKKVLNSFAVLPANCECSPEEIRQWFGFANEDLDELIQDGWLSYDEGKQTFSMHPLVRMIVRFDFADDAQGHKKAIAPEGTTDKILEYFSGALFDIGDGYKSLQRRIDVAESAISAVEQKETVMMSFVYHQLGSGYYYLSDYDKALEYFEKALEIKESKLVKDHPSTATTYNNIAEAYRDKGDYDKALEYYGKALEIVVSRLGKDHPSTATTYNNIAAVYSAKDDYDKTLEYYGKALEIGESKLGKDHPSTATTYNNIAMVYDAKGDYDKALVYYEKALEIQKSKLGEDHPSTATTYNNIAGVYDNKGDYDKALEYYGKTLIIRESKLGKDHLSTATTYNNIAGAYYAKGDYDNAFEYYEKALEIIESKLGKDYPDTALTYSNIAFVYRNKGDYDNALKFYQKALEIEEKVFGINHTITADSQYNIGLVYEKQSEYDNALEYFNKAYLIYGKVYGQNHPYTISVSKQIALTTSIRHGKMQKLPIGLQNFENLRIEKYAYVDKTELVFDLVDYGKFFFLSRPRRFGKSLLISTLKAYFEGKKELFEDLAITNLEKTWDSFPVLYLDLNVGMYTSKEGLLETLNFNLNEWEEKYGITSNLTDVAQRFKNIIQKVAQQEKRNVVILVDEYDKPLLQAIDDEPLQQDYRNILKSFFSNLKTCDGFIRFAMLTGVSKFSQICLFSDLNNLIDISLNKKFANICGITADEIYQTFSVHLDSFVKQENVDEETLMKKMRQMYGGYHFSEDISLDIYNPFSVLNALSEKRFRNYWFSTGTPSFLIKLLQKGDYDLQQFSEGNIKANDLSAKESLIEEPIALFYQTGYLTIKEYNKNRENYNLGFPNRDVERGFLSFLLPRYTGKTDVGSTTFLDSILKDLHEGDIKDFLERMKSFFANTPYELIRDLENHYQNVMFTICRLTSYHTEAEYHTSYGRIDMVVKTEKFIYVFEFKFNKTAEEALKQIDTKEYLLPFRSDGRKLCKIGANFSGETNNIDHFIAVLEGNPPIVIRD